MARASLFSQRVEGAVSLDLLLISAESPLHMRVAVTWDDPSRGTPPPETPWQQPFLLEVAAAVMDLMARGIFY